MYRPFASATFELTQSVGIMVDDPDSAGMLTGDLLEFTLTNVNLFVGSGASFDGSGNLIDGDIGFTVSGGSLALAIFTTDAMVTYGAEERL